MNVHGDQAVHPLVGVWRVTVQGAPFPYHLFAFHSDGTLHQTNPPEGNKETSDTAGLGVWAVKDAKKGAIQARFEEFRVRFEDGAVTRGVVEFSLRLSGDTLRGSCRFTIYDPQTDKPLEAPKEATLIGHRITID